MDRADNTLVDRTTRVAGRTTRWTTPPQQADGMTVVDVLPRSSLEFAGQAPYGLVRLCCALTVYGQLNTPGVPHLETKLGCVRSLCHGSASPTEEDRCDSGEGAS
jgi:hypothetical protein